MPQVSIADVDSNVERICALADRAYASGVRLLVFPELCLSRLHLQPTCSFNKSCK